MKLQGSKRWRGRKPSGITLKQSLIMYVIKAMTGDRMRGYYNSRTAYAFIGKYKDELDRRILATYVQDKEEDPYLLYIDIFIDREYAFTIKNFCREEVSNLSMVQNVNIARYEIYKKEHVNDDLSLARPFSV